MRSLSALHLVLILIVLGTCQRSQVPEAQPATPHATVRQPGDSTMQSWSLRSTAFDAQARVPQRHTGDGVDLSPPLTWTPAPAGTRELALVVDDPDAPTAEPWVHWLLYKIPPQTTSLEEGIPTTRSLSQPPGAVQGQNSWRTVGYRGPAPPPGHGTHHYHFKLYALDAPLTLEPGLDKRKLLAAMEGHVVAEAELVGTYSR